MRLILIALLSFLVLLQGRLWLGNGGLRDVWHLRAAVAEGERENERLRRRNEELAAEVRNLKLGHDAIEERARAELGMIGEDETFYHIVPRR